MTGLVKGFRGGKIVELTEAGAVTPATPAARPRVMAIRDEEPVELAGDGPEAVTEDHPVDVKAPAKAKRKKPAKEPKAPKEESIEDDFDGLK